MSSKANPQHANGLGVGPALPSTGTSGDLVVSKRHVCELRMFWGGEKSVGQINGQYSSELVKRIESECTKGIYIPTCSSKVTDLLFRKKNRRKGDRALRPEILIPASAFLLPSPATAPSPSPDAARV